MDTFNGRVHSVTRRVPAEALAGGAGFLHPVPDAPYTAAFGESRRVGWSSTISFRGARYSVPHRFCDTRVWVRQGAGEVIIVAGEGPARHRSGPSPRPSSGRVLHLRRALPRAPQRAPRATSPATSRSEEQFLALGEGAKRYLVEGAATRSPAPRSSHGRGRPLAALHGAGPVDEALGLAAMAGRFCEGDLESIIVHAAGALRVRAVPPPEHSLAQGTAAWSALGTNEVEQ